MEPMNTQQITTIHAAASHFGRLRPDDPAIFYEDEQVTFGELDRESNRAAHALRGAGPRPGARVAYFGKDSPAYYEIALACAKSGTVLVPVNWRLSSHEVDHILRDSGASLLFVEPEFKAAAEHAIAGPAADGRLEMIIIDPPSGFHAWKAGYPETGLDPGTGPDDPVIQIYTSGTTGLPKGVVLAHRSFFTFRESMIRAGADWLDWRPADVSLVSFPGSYVAGMSWFMHGLVAGLPSVIMRMFIAEEAVRLIERHRVSITFAAPAMLHMMLAEPGAGPATFASLRKVAYGAAPMPDALLRSCMEIMRCQFAQIYASSESGNVATMLPPADHVPGSPLLRSVGLPCPGNELRIIDRDGRPLPPGAVGQVCIRTPARMVGYWGMPEATAQTLADGWLRMGDAGYVDEDGYLYLRDRIDDTIIVAGQNVYPAEVETALQELPAVAEAAVIGVPHDQWGEVVRAYVCLAEGATATPGELRRSLRGRIADFKLPAEYVLVDALPRNPSGKVLRRVLREQARTGQAPEETVP